MNALRQVEFDTIGRLFCYPTASYAADALDLAGSLHTTGSRAAEPMCRFADYAASVSPHELEETFTRTFDLNPACAAEIGWHLFGEEYLRGLFMVRIRAEMRERGLEETGELPDHVVHVLAVLAAMESKPAREFTRACVCPAVGKMQRALDEKNGGGQPPFRPLVDALAELLLEEFELPSDALCAEEGDTAAFVASDPLQGPPCGAGGCGDEPELFSLEPSCAACIRAGHYDEAGECHRGDAAMTSRYLDQLMFVALPYVALSTFFLMTIYRYRAQSFSYSSLSSQFLENKQHFWAVVPFHYAVLVVTAGHLVAWFVPRSVLAWNSHPLRLYILEVSALACGLLTFIGLLGIVWRRFTTSKVRRITTITDWIIYGILLLQVASGVGIALLHPWGSSWFATSLSPYLWSIFTLSPDVSYIAAMPVLVKFHIVFAFVTVGFFPFTRLVHILVIPNPYLWRKPQVVRWYRGPKDTPRAG